MAARALKQQTLGNSHATPLAPVLFAARRGKKSAELLSTVRGLLRALLLVLIAATELSGQPIEAICLWLPWHPSTAPADASGEGASFETLQYLCNPSRYITDFYVNATKSPDGSGTAIRYLSARCSDGSYNGYQAQLDKSPLAENVASSSLGFKALNGSATTILESIGVVTDGAAAWSDICPMGSLISGFQVTFVPSEPISQIRLLCSSAVAPACDGAGGPSIPFLGPRPEDAGGPVGSFPLYVVFAIQWTSPSVIASDDIQKALHAVNGLEPTQLEYLGQDCAANVSVVAANTFVNCFQAGPIDSGAALYILRGLSSSNSSLAFSQALNVLGEEASNAKILFTAISATPVTGYRVPPVAITPTPSPAGMDEKFKIGLIAGCSIAGGLAAGLLVLIFVYLIRRRQPPSPCNLPRHSQDCKLCPKEDDQQSPPSKSQPPPRGPGPVMKSPFAALSLGTNPWAPEPWAPPRDIADPSAPDDSLPQPGSAAAVRRAKAQNLGGLRSAPLPRGPPKPPLPLWTAQPPPISMQAISMVPPSFAPVPQAKQCSWLTQDSDELMEAGQGQNPWKAMLEEDLAGPEGDLGPLTHERNVSSDGPVAALSPVPSVSHSSNGAIEDWEIRPSDLKICHEADGRLFELGTGAFGKVYKAVLNDVTEVAVKRLETVSGGQRTLFLREIEIHKRCRSAHVVQFLGACIESDCMFLVMELMDESLDHIIHDERREFTWQADGHRIALDVAQALAYLHKQRVVHLDIKSRNVLLTREGRAKVADVGLSQVLQNTYLSQVDGLGTFAYAAPELLSGGSNCSTKADIWSYGVLLHEMMTREHPKRGALSDRELDICPAHVDNLIQRCLERNPADRPSAKAIVQVLQADTPDLAEAILAADLLRHADSSSTKSRARLRQLHTISRRNTMPDIVTANLTRWSCY